MIKNQIIGVSGGVAPIHSAICKGAKITKVWLDPALGSTQSRARRQSQHWNLTQCPYNGNPMHCQMPGLLLAFGRCFVPRLPLTRFQRADSRHATPVRACISPDLRSLSAFSGSFRMLPHQQHLIGHQKFDRTHQRCSYRIL